MIRKGVGIMSYLDSFSDDDRKRVFEFFGSYSRLECGLKRYYPREGSYGVAMADWDKFANQWASDMENGTDLFKASQSRLLDQPPARQMYQPQGEPTWGANPRRKAESDAIYLLRVVRDIRNNLFHGGKYQGGPMNDLVRDRDLIDAATTVIKEVASLDPKINELFG